TDIVSVDEHTTEVREEATQKKPQVELNLRMYDPYDTEAIRPLAEHYAGAETFAAMATLVDPAARAAHDKKVLERKAALAASRGKTFDSKAYYESQKALKNRFKKRVTKRVHEVL